jgi:hypothetical protein
MAPVPSAEVTVASGATETQSTRTDTEGFAELVPAGLRSRPGFARDDLFVLELAVEASGFLRQTVAVPVDPGTSWSDLQVLLDPAWTVSVRVLRPGGEEGVFQASVLHQWDHGSRGRANKEERTYLTDQRGLVDLPLGKGASRLEVLASHPDYAPTGAVVGASELLESMSVSIELQPGVVVEGVVLDELGDPVPRVTVDLNPRDRQDYNDWMRFVAWKFLDGAPDMTGTREDGTFLLPRVAPGTYSVKLVHRDYSPDPANPLLVVGPSNAEPWIGPWSRVCPLREESSTTPENPSRASRSSSGPLPSAPTTHRLWGRPCALSPTADSS